ncbi:M15 family metallopeptidase [Aliiroseovarius sp. YM-037]|uniref:M15 family metallopeptidase n=1 Tax=Aliiroseovarius sp. YM-037 TaxID=3341728 RepID=UPI003A7FB45E
MSPGQIAGALIIAIGMVVAAIAFSVVGALLQTADGGTDLRLQRLEAEAVEWQEKARALETELSQVRADIATLREDLSLVANRAPTAQSNVPIATPSGDVPVVLFDHGETEELTEEMQLAKARFNTGVSQPNNRVMHEILGPPRSSYGTDCQPVTNPNLKGLLKTAQVANIRVTMIQPAIESLERIMARLEASDPDIHAKVGTAGALCARLIRGSSRSVSNHSWGTAIDIKLEGVLDRFADGGTQFGLLILAEYFNDEGWYWGATYNREDSMHFEVGVETLRRWQAEGLLTPGAE